MKNSEYYSPPSETYLKEILFLHMFSALLLILFNFIWLLYSHRLDLMLSFNFLSFCYNSKSSYIFTFSDYSSKTSLLILFFFDIFSDFYGLTGLTEGKISILSSIFNGFWVFTTIISFIIGISWRFCAMGYSDRKRWE